MEAEQEWPRMLHVREPGGEPEHSEPMKVSEAGRWEYQDYWPESRVREELETAWLRGFIARAPGGKVLELRKTEAEEEAADYAERVVGGSTRPERPETNDV